MRINSKRPIQLSCCSTYPYKYRSNRLHIQCLQKEEKKTKWNSKINFNNFPSFYHKFKWPTEFLMISSLFYLLSIHFISGISFNWFTKQINTKILTGELDIGNTFKSMLMTAQIYRDHRTMTHLMHMALHYLEFCIYAGPFKHFQHIQTIYSLFGINLTLDVNGNVFINFGGKSRQSIYLSIYLSFYILR